MEERSGEVDCGVFGSAAKGNWTQGSDVDALVGLRVDDGLRLTDRIGLFARWVTGNLEVFPYAHSQWERRFAPKHLLLLEALADGIILVDRGLSQRCGQSFKSGWRKGVFGGYRAGGKFWTMRRGDDDAFGRL